MRVVLAEPDPATLARLRERAETVKGCRLVAAVADLTATYTVAEHKIPNVVLISTRLAAEAEFEVLCLLFRALSIRCILVSPNALPQAAERDIALRSVLQLVTMAECAEALRTPNSARVRSKPDANAHSKGENPVGFDNGLILIGASTGGVDALIITLSSFPKDCPPTLIVQHTGASFTKGLAQLLNGHVHPDVREARAGDRPASGQVLLAPGGQQHLVLKRFPDAVCGFVGGAPINGHRPSVDQLFQSAVPGAKQVAAAILTGMGRDGADGLLKLRHAGASTFGQNERSSVVYGMPRAAWERGAVGKQLPLEAIGPALLQARKQRA